jgi:hypothetical protein
VLARTRVIVIGSADDVQRVITDVAAKLRAIVCGGDLGACGSKNRS